MYDVGVLKMWNAVHRVNVSSEVLMNNRLIIIVYGLFVVVLFKIRFLSLLPK